MPEIGGVDLGKKIGPVPVWVIVGAGGLALAYFINRNFMGRGSSVSLGSGVGGMPGGFVPVSPDTETPTGPLDNEAWAVKAVAYLVSNNYNPVEAGVAVRKYLDGERLTSRELAMINAVVNAIGVPPNIPIGGGVEPPVGTNPPPPVTQLPPITGPIPRRPPPDISIPIGTDPIPRRTDTDSTTTIPRR